MPVAHGAWGLGNKGHDVADVETDSDDEDHAPSSPYDATGNVEYDQPCECAECSQVWSDNEEDECQLNLDGDEMLEMRAEWLELFSDDPAFAKHFIGPPPPSPCMFGKRRK